MDVIKIDTTNQRDAKRFLDFPFRLYQSVQAVLLEMCQLDRASSPTPVGSS